MSDDLRRDENRGRWPFIARIVAGSIVGAAVGAGAAWMINVDPLIAALLGALPGAIVGNAAQLS